MKLYMVAVEFTVMVRAESENDAERFATDNLHEIELNENPSVSSWTPSINDERAWAKSIPYGESEGRTVAELTP